MTIKQMAIVLLAVCVVIGGIASGYNADQVAQAQGGTGECQGVVIRDQLPVRDAPTWFSGDRGRQLVEGQIIYIRSTHYRTLTGEIWYEIGAGDWAQAYTGHTTGISQIIAADLICMMTIPCEVSFELPYQWQEALKNSQP
jgi:hypothetical protein